MQQTDSIHFCNTKNILCKDLTWKVKLFVQKWHQHGVCDFQHAKAIRICSNSLLHIAFLPFGNHICICLEISACLLSTSNQETCSIDDLKALSIKEHASRKGISTALSKGLKRILKRSLRTTIFPLGIDPMNRRDCYFDSARSK